MPVTIPAVRGISASIACAAFAAFVGVGSAQAPTIQVSIALDKSRVIPGEPVVVHTLLANRSTGAVSLPTELSPEYGRLRYVIRAGDGPPRDFLPWAIIENDLEELLGPGASRAVSAKIFYGAEGWTFRSPGSFRIQAVFRGAASEPVVLTVTAPANVDEQRQTSRLLETPAAGLFLLVEGGDSDGPGARVIADIANSGTRLAGYANHVMGSNLARRFVNFGTGAIRAPDLGQADTFLNRSQSLLTDAPYYVLEGNALRVDIARSLGRPQAEALNLRQLRLRQDSLLAGPLPLATRRFVEQTIKQ